MLILEYSEFYFDLLHIKKAGNVGYRAVQLICIPVWCITMERTTEHTVDALNFIKVYYSVSGRQPDPLFVHMVYFIAFICTVCTFYKCMYMMYVCSTKHVVKCFSALSFVQ